MKVHFKNIFTLLKTSSSSWWAKDPFKESAVIAYYAIFSLPGVLVVIVSIAGYFYGQDAVNGKLTSEISSTMGIDTAQQIQSIIATASQSKNSLWASVIGIFTILLGATGVFVQLQKSLNAIWNVEPDIAKSGILALLKARLFSFGLILSISFILIVSLVISAALAAFGVWLTSHFSESLLIFIQIANSLISLFILATLFAMMFKFLPDAKIKWKHVWVGSMVTAFLFEIGKLVLGYYFGTANPGSGYGAAGSLILILLWVSYSSIIVFYGAEFTHAYAEMQDGTIEPNQNAVVAATTIE